MDQQTQPTTEEQIVVSDFLNLENLIKSHAESIEKMQTDLKAKREMFEDSFGNNPTYREHAEKVKEATKAKASVKLEISKQPAVAKLKQEISDIKFSINESKKTMGELLLDYKEQTGATQLELFNGKIFEIEVSAKLVRRSATGN